jgi:hypothetical protein
MTSGGYLDGRGSRLAGLAALVSGAGSSGELLGTGAATAALFLASPESRWITGVTLPVDAGTTMATGLGMLARLTS